MDTSALHLGALAGRDILSIDDLAAGEIRLIWKVAGAIQDLRSRGHSLTGVLKGRTLASIFCEPSTRTRLSFATAAYLLGMNVESVVGKETSSLAKEESWEDMGRIVGGTSDTFGYADVIVMRSAEKGSVARLAVGSEAPVISGGEGTGEHPTQALLDGFCLLNELGLQELEGITVTICGDLAFGRTAHSLLALLAKFPGNSVNLWSPPFFEMPQELVDPHLQHVMIRYGTKTDSLHLMATSSDVLYVTRAQSERMTPQQVMMAKHYPYRIDMGLVEQANFHRARDGRQPLVIMHPLPRVNELPITPEEYPGLACFRQAAGGIFVRMALLALVTGRK